MCAENRPMLEHFWTPEVFTMTDTKQLYLPDKIVENIGFVLIEIYSITKLGNYNKFWSIMAVLHNTEFYNELKTFLLKKDWQQLNNNINKIIIYYKKMTPSLKINEKIMKNIM